MFFLILLAFLIANFIMLLVLVTRPKESFCGCSGIQYNGIYEQEKPDAPICPSADQLPPSGGCYSPINRRTKAAVS